MESRVTVGLVVVAEINEIQVAVNRRGGRAQTYVSGRPVAGDDHHLKIVFLCQFPLIPLNIQGVTHPLRCRNRRSHGGVQPGTLERGEWVHRQEGEASRRIGDEDIVAQFFEPQTKALQTTATRAKSGPWSDLLYGMQVSDFFIVRGCLDHDFSPLLCQRNFLKLLELVPIPFVEKVNRPLRF